MDQFKFTRALYESFSSMPQDVKHELFDALMAYVFEDKEPTLVSDMGKVVWPLIAERIKRSMAQSINGSLGGAKEGNGNASKIPKSKPKPKPNPKPKPQIEATDERFIKFNAWIKSELPYISNPSNIRQLTQDEFLRLMSKYSSEKIANVLRDLENRKDLRKKYSSLYRTLINWLKREDK